MLRARRSYGERLIPPDAQMGKLAIPMPLPIGITNLTGTALWCMISLQLHIVWTIQVPVAPDGTGGNGEVGDPRDLGMRASHMGSPTLSRNCRVAETSPWHPLPSQVIHLCCAPRFAFAVKGVVQHNSTDHTPRHCRRGCFL